MIQIYKTILFAYKEKFSKSSKEFKSGFLACLIMLETGIKKSSSYNLGVKLREEEIRNSKIKKENFRLRGEIKYLKDKLSEVSLVSEFPSEVFNTFELVTKDNKTFTIVGNCSKDVMYAFFVSFTMSTPYSSVDECKSKFLLFLKQSESRDFKFYKDLKTAKKENYDRRENKQGD